MVESTPRNNFTPNAILDAFPLSIKHDILTPTLANNSKKKKPPLPWLLWSRRRSLDFTEENHYEH